MVVAAYARLRAAEGPLFVEAGAAGAAAAAASTSAISLDLFVGSVVVFWCVWYG